MRFCVAGQYWLYDFCAAFYSSCGENTTILLSDKSDFFHFLTFSICFWLSTFFFSFVFGQVVFFLLDRTESDSLNQLIKPLFLNCLQGLFSLGTTLKYKCISMQPSGAHTHTGAMHNHDEPAMSRGDQKGFNVWTCKKLIEKKWG